MEFFNNGKAVRLKSHLQKYLVAEKDEESVRQNHNGSSRKALWVVEFVEDNPHHIRLKSCYDKYLTASDEPFLLGMTGKKVIQTIPATKKDNSIEWEPIREGDLVRLRARGAKFLRANGATPPWRNSVTIDLPHRTATQDWVLWEVDVVDMSMLEYSSEYLSSSSCGSSFSSLPDDSTISQSRSMPITSESCSSPSSVVTSEKRWLSMPPDMSIIANGRQWQSGMEVFEKAKAVRLRSHLGKYLVADDDEETVTQIRDGSSQNARWTVEFVQGKSHVIRLKSCHGLYLTATDEPFLLGWTGKKVRQTLPCKTMDTSIEWEPILEGFHVKLRTSEGKFMRGNGATPPWRNSVTHDVPHRSATQSWVLWGVDIVDMAISDTESSVASSLSPTSSFNSLPDDYTGSPDVGSPSVHPERFGNASLRSNSGMEFFMRAKSVRLRSHHDKYLTADQDQESVTQDRSGTTRNAKWTVEFVEGFDNVIRLKSCYGKYLTAKEEHLLLGVSGRKVQQIMPRKMDSSIEWEPIREGTLVRLKTRYGNFLRANGGLPPLRNSVTHDIPHRHTDWVLWQVDIIEMQPQPPKKVPKPEPDPVEEDLSSSEFHFVTPGFCPLESSASVDSPKKSEGRIVYYRVMDDDGNVDDAIKETCFQFKGHGLQELTQKLEEETGLENIVLCLRNPLNGQLYPLRLSLPPNNATMHVVIVPSTSKGAGEFRST